MLVAFGIGGVIYTWVLITYLPQTNNADLSFVLVAVGYVILTGYTSINAIVKAELFPAHIRALGLGLGYAWPTRVRRHLPVDLPGVKPADQVRCSSPT